LIDNLRFILVAGFDTTKASFGAISQFVTRDPKLEAVLVEEVQSLKEPLDIDQLKHESPILNAVMAESWRLTAPLSSHATCATQDLHYKGYVIPKGTFVSADIHGHAVMNDARYPKASEFHYERWLTKDHPLYNHAVANVEDIDYNVMNIKFRTFSMGSHMCLGGHFAKLEVRIVVARLFQKYKIETRNERVASFPLRQVLSDFKISERER
jgi:cytochrome P450